MVTYILKYSIAMIGIFLPISIQRHQYVKEKSNRTSNANKNTNEKKKNDRSLS